MKARGLMMLAMVFLLGAEAPKDADIPELNQKVLAFARDKLGKKVGDGECATLVVHALRAAGAQRMQITDDGDYVWGKRLRTITPKDKAAGDVRPGDILQFRDAVLVWKVRRETFEAAYPHHTAIVEAVKDAGKIVELLHQNAGDFRASDEERRKVQRATLRFADLKKGSIKVYRPAPPAEEKK